jgi:hypothetical protein
MKCVYHQKKGKIFGGMIKCVKYDIEAMKTDI